MSEPGKESEHRGGCGPWAAGCALGCAGLLVLAGAGTVAGVRWATRPTELPGAEALLTPEAHAYLALTLDLSNPETAQFIPIVLEQRRKGRGGPMPFRKALPLRLACTLVGEPARGVCALSVSRYANLMALPLLPVRLGRGGGIERYRDEIVLRDEHGHSDVAFAIAGGSLLLGSDLAAVQFAIDRLKDSDGGRPGEAMAALWPGVKAGAAPAPIRVAAENRKGELRRGFEIFETSVLDRVIARDEAALAVLDRASGVSLTARAGIPDPGSLEGTLELVFAGDAAAELEAIRGLGPGLREALAAKGVLPSATVVAEGSRLRVDFRIDRLAQAIAGRSARFGPVEIR